MAVEDTHAQYDAHISMWNKCRTVVAGEESVKGEGVEFLPMLSGQDKNDYNAYLKRASFFNASARTVDGLSGMVFRKNPMVESPAALEDALDDVTMDGVSLTSFAEQLVEEILCAGRAGIVVDFPRIENPGAIRTVAEVERENLRPFLRLYEARDVFNWRLDRVNNRTQLVQVRLTEFVEEAGDDEFETTTVPQIRVLELTDGGVENGALFYQQRIFRKNEANGKWEQFGDPIVPLRRGERLDFIPFVFIGPRDTSPRVVRPPLLDLVNTNLSHYRTSADLEHGAHYVGLPTPYCFGVRDEEVPSTIGPEKIWAGNSTEVQVGMLEFTGQGLGAIEKLLDRKESQMAVLGARMLFPEKRAVEAVETAAMHRQGENSSLASLAFSASRGLTMALVIMRDWMGLAGDVSVALNTDYIPVPMSPQQLTALVGALQANSISRETFFDALKRGEVIASDRTFEDEQADIETGAVPGLGFPPPPAEDDDEDDEDDV